LHAAFVDTAVLEASQVPFLESRPATSSICGGSLNVPIWSTSSVRLKVAISARRSTYFSDVVAMRMYA
jgi:hypothetical protein